MRLIDADALKEKYTRNFDYENCIYDGATVVGNVDEAPTVDAVPVRHGKWKKTSCKWVTYECSECGEKTDETIMGLPRYVYCPMCGARMDKNEIG